MPAEIASRTYRPAINGDYGSYTSDPTHQLAFDMRELPPVYARDFEFALVDGTRLTLPIKPLPNSNHGLPRLEIDQIPLSQREGLYRTFIYGTYSEIRAFKPDVFVGIASSGYDPTERLALAHRHDHFICIHDVSDQQERSPFSARSRQREFELDPEAEQFVAGANAVLTDDVTHTGQTLKSAIEILRKANVGRLLIAVILTAGHEWKDRLERMRISPRNNMVSVGHLPIFQRCETGWVVIPETDHP